MFCLLMHFGRPGASSCQHADGQNLEQHAMRGIKQIQLQGALLPLVAVRVKACPIV